MLLPEVDDIEPVAGSSSVLSLNFASRRGKSILGSRSENKFFDPTAVEVEVDIISSDCVVASCGKTAAETHLLSKSGYFGPD